MREEQAYRAATMYYVQHHTMEVIGSTLGVSRSTVSRLLATARETGIVTVQVEAPSGAEQRWGRELAEQFNVRAHVVPVRQRTTELQRLDQVAAVAARLVGQWFEPGATLGVAWGTTLAAIANHLVPTPIPDTCVVQLNGSANTQTTGLTYASDLLGMICTAFDSVPYYFPVPAFFDYPETKSLMWQERSIMGIHRVHRQVDMALFGVGSHMATVPSHVYSAGYLDADDLAAIERERVVGDVCTVFLREDGSYRDISLNARASGPTPHELRQMHRRVCVVVGDSKVPALLGALNARVATDLIIDEGTARTLLAYSRRREIAHH